MFDVRPLGMLTPTLYSVSSYVDTYFLFNVQLHGHLLFLHFPSLSSVSSYVDTYCFFTARLFLSTHLTWILTSSSLSILHRQLLFLVYHFHCLYHTDSHSWMVASDDTGFRHYGRLRTPTKGLYIDTFCINSQYV